MPKNVRRYRMSGMWGQIARLGNDESNCWSKVFAEGWVFLLRRGGEVGAILVS